MDPYETFIPRLVKAELDLRTLRQDLSEYFQTQPAPAAAPSAPLSSVESTVEAIFAAPSPPQTFSWEASAARAQPARHATLEEERAEQRVSNAKLEAFIAGRGFYAVGLLLVFLAAAYFVKIAFDNWIGPDGRVALGLVAGLAVVGGAMRVRRPAFRGYADGLIALGFAIEFTALYAATSLYHLINEEATVGALAVVVGALCTIAYTRKSEPLALCAAFGGFLAPPIIGITTTSPAAYTEYIAVLDIGLAALAYLRRWVFVTPALFIGTMASYSCYIANLDGASPIIRAIIATAFYLVFVGLPQRRPVAADNAAESASDVRHLLLIVNTAAAAWLAYTFETVLAGASGLIRGDFFAGVTAAHLALAIAFKAKHHLRLAYTFATIAICELFGGATRDIALSLEGFSLYYIGVKNVDGLFRFAGGALLTASGSYACFALSGDTQTVAICNPRFLSLAVFAGCILQMVRLIRDNRELLSEFERGIATAARVFGHAVIVYALSADGWDIASRLDTSVTFSAYGALPQVTVSMIWTACAALLITCGLRFNDTVLRWEGLALIAAVACKVICVDLSSQNMAYRVISALVVGVVAIAVAGQYQGRMKSAERAE